MSDDPDRPTTGCETCDEVNLSNASLGILQMVSCETNDITSIDEAIALVRQDIAFQQADQTDVDR